MANRGVLDGDSTNVPWRDAGADEGFVEEYARIRDTLMDAASFPLTNVGGTGDAVTADLDPVLNASGLTDGMKFTVIWAAGNTGAVTLAINGGAPVDVLDAGGVSLTAGTLVADTLAMIEYRGSAFRLLGGSGGGASKKIDRQQFDASGTWSKPLGYTADAIVNVRAWGAGAGGSASGTERGGGGGAYREVKYRYGDLPASVAVLIGGGGVASNGDASGGDSSFGTLLVAPGGKGGSLIPEGGAAPAPTNSDAKDGFFSGGFGGTSGSLSSGGASEYGGGGGASQSGGTGGVSTHGGDGGDPGNAGEIPGGGGGYQAPGARGRIIVEVWE